MSRYPKATWRAVTRYQSGSLRLPITPRRLVLHTAVSNSTPSMHSYFNVDGRATPHFYVGKGGEVEQYIETDHRATALLDGNHDAITVETWDGYGSTWNGGGDGPAWTDAQVVALADLAAWVNRKHGIPLVRLPSSRPGTTGVGWHRQGCDGNYEQPPGELLGGRVDGGERWSTSAGKVCPTTTRIKQVGNIIARAKRSSGKEVPMSDDKVGGPLRQAEAELTKAWENAEGKRKERIKGPLQDVRAILDLSRDGKG